VLNFGRVTYNIRAKKAIQRQALLRYANSVVSAFADVEKALVQYYKEQERAKILDQAFCGATKELAYSKDLFNAGLADQDSYLLAQMRRIEIEQLLTEAQRGMSLALVTVYKALGGGWTQEGGDHV
jgi:outer membrane protein TolC